MPIQQVNLNIMSQWIMSRTNTGFATTVAGPDSINFTLTGINTTTFNQLAPLQYTILTTASQTVDLSALVNTVYESFGLLHALTIVVSPVGSSVTIAPGASNGLTWWFGGTTPTITVPAGGFFCFSEPVAGPGHVVDATHKTLLFTNNGGTTLTLSLLVIGSTT